MAEGQVIMLSGNSGSVDFAKIRRYIRELPGYGRTAVFVVLLLGLVSLLALVFPILIQKLPGYFQQQRGGPFIAVLAGLALVQMVQAQLQYLALHRTQVFAVEANAHVLTSFFDRVLSLPLARFQSFRSTGDIFQRVFDTLQLNQIVVVDFAELCVALLSTLVYTSIGFYVHWSIGLSILVLFPLYLVINRRYSRKISALEGPALGAQAMLSNHLLYGINQLVTIKALGAKQQVVGQLADHAGVQVATRLAQVRYATRVNTVNAHMLILAKLAVLLLGGLVTLQGSISLGRGPDSTGHHPKSVRSPAKHGSPVHLTGACIGYSWPLLRIDARARRIRGPIGQSHHRPEPALRTSFRPTVLCL